MPALGPHLARTWPALGPHRTCLCVGKGRAFTIIELVVVLGIVLVLLGLLLPAMRGTKQEAQMTRELSQVRSNLVIVSQYAAVYSDFFPVNGSSFAAAAAKWKAAVVKAGIADATRDLQWGKLPYNFSYVAFVDPQIVQRGMVPPQDQTPFSPQKIGSVRFPSSKGLLWPIRRQDERVGETWCCAPTSLAGAIGFADGSVGVYRWSEFGENSEFVTEFWAGLPVISTWGGIHGRDRKE